MLTLRARYGPPNRQTDRPGRSSRPLSTWTPLSRTLARGRGSAVLLLRDEEGRPDRELKDDLDPRVDRAQLRVVHGLELPRVAVPVRQAAL